MAVLNGTRLGCYNGHASLLPRWRGAAPINRAIMAGDRETGMMIMKMDAGLDTGDIALEERIPIGEDMTAGELHDILSALCADLMVRAMTALERGSLRLTRQPEEGVTYASKIAKDETRIDWSRPAPEVHNHIRGLSPFPGAWCEMRFGEKWERVKLLGSKCVPSAGENDSAPALDIGSGCIAVGCGAGSVELTRLQRAGGKPLSASDFLRGAPVSGIR
jgi:methionyl-tRNA formyltransferase